MAVETLPETGPETGPHTIRTEIAVVGSGPGGAVTAAVLAQAGRRVTLIEEGPDLPPHSSEPYSREEMTAKYRNGGITVAMGRPRVSYVEGRCVGGGSEINSGLYHRTPEPVLVAWQRDFGVEHLTAADLEPHFRAAEERLGVGVSPGPLPGASQKLALGAAALGWESLEVPRWVRPAPPEGGGGEIRQSMSRTFLPDALAAGCRLLADTAVRRLHKTPGGWRLEAEHRPAGGPVAPLTVLADAVFVAAGAVQTPALLRRSGIRSHVGNTLGVHPTVKVVARFPQPVNTAQAGVPAHQVKQFAPDYSFGCSVSSPPYLALALLKRPGQTALVVREWERMAVFYAMTSGGAGTVRPLPGFRDPLVRYRVGREVLGKLGLGLRDLCRLLLAAGAEALYPTVGGLEPITSQEGLAAIPDQLPAGRTELMTVHLFGSCPMGGSPRRGAVDSFGAVYGHPGLHVADASLFCGPPGVNPQGTVMALARRNALKFLYGL